MTALPPPLAAAASAPGAPACPAESKPANLCKVQAEPAAQGKRVSIIVPTFNAAAVLDGCLRSLAEQQQAAHEVLVMDGGSTDATAAIVARYAAHMPGLRWHSGRDRGIYDAMNKGIDAASGDWLVFLGADDRLHDPQVLAHMAQHLDDTTDFVYGNIHRVSRQREEGGVYDLDRLSIQNICHQAIFYRRSLLARVGPYALTYPVYADWDLNLRCWAAGCRPRHVPRLVSFYDGGGFSARTTDQRFVADKHALIARYHGVGLLARPLRGCRFEFRAQAQQLWAQKQWRRALRPSLLYLWHSAAARIDRLRQR